MANPIAESILALFSGGAQGYVGARAKQQATEDANQRLLDQLAERRVARAQAGQEAASQQELTRSEAAATRAQSASQFGAEQKFAGEKFAFEKGRTEDINALKSKIQSQELSFKKQQLDAEEMQLRLVGTIASLQGKNPRDYLAEGERKFYAGILSNPDIKPEEAAIRIKNYNAFTSLLEKQTTLGGGGTTGIYGPPGPSGPSVDYGGYQLNPKTGGYEPPPPPPSGRDVLFKTGGTLLGKGGSAYLKLIQDILGGALDTGYGTPQITVKQHKTLSQ